MKHKHHIIPKHAGGPDDSSNLVLLTIEEHAAAHRLLFEEHGRWQDRVAWLSLSGMMGHEERIREIMSNANRGNPSNWRPSDEHRRKMSEVLKGMIRPQGEENCRYGTHLGADTKRKISDSLKGRKWSAETRAKQEIIRSQPDYYNYLSNAERGQKISNAKKGKPGAAKGKHWYNNGDSETYADTCPIGYRDGRLKKTTNGKKGLMWYTDNVESRQFKENEQPEGWHRGRSTNKKQ